MMNLRHLIGPWYLLTSLWFGACAQVPTTAKSPSPTSAVAMETMAKANEEIVRTFVNVTKNQRHLDRLGEFFDPAYVEHNQTVASFGPGIAGYKAFLGHLFEAFPDDQVTIDQLVANPEWVSYRATESGTHKATFLGIPATGKHATWTEIQFFRIKNGRIVEHWVDVDLFAWFTQLGIIPAMGK
jgi:steroid delta-isomerase-like uncharacterized protein